MATPVGLLSAPFSCNKVAAQRRNKTLITYRALRPERRAQLRRQAQHAGSSNTSGRRQKCLRIACQVAQVRSVSDCLPPTDHPPAARPAVTALSSCHFCDLQGTPQSVPAGSVSLVLLAGGVGKRMGVSAAHRCSAATRPCRDLAALRYPAPRMHSAIIAPRHWVQAAIPKQYLELNGQPIATYSLRTFAAMPQVREVVVVCEPDWR